MVDIRSRDCRSPREDVFVSDKRRKCTPEFRAEAVKSVTDIGRTAAHVAAELGVGAAGPLGAAGHQGPGRRGRSAVLRYRRGPS